MTEYYRLALLRVLAGLFVSAGITSESQLVDKLPRHVRNAILLVLRPAESAARRLIAAEAQRGCFDPSPEAGEGRFRVSCFLSYQFKSDILGAFSAKHEIFCF